MSLILYPQYLYYLQLLLCLKSMLLSWKSMAVSYDRQWSMIREIECIVSYAAQFNARMNIENTRWITVCCRLVITDDWKRRIFDETRCWLFCFKKSGVDLSQKIHSLHEITNFPILLQFKCWSVGTEMGGCLALFYMKYFYNLIMKCNIFHVFKMLQTWTFLAHCWVLVEWSLENVQKTTWTTWGHWLYYLTCNHWGEQSPITIKC